MTPPRADGRSSWLRAAARGAAGRALRYARRVGRWPLLLQQVRGQTWADEWALVRSALLAPLVSGRDLSTWQDPLLVRPAAVTVPGVGRFRLRARCDDLWHVAPWRERAVFGAIARLLRPGDWFVDAGANIGCYTVLAGKRVGPRGRVDAFEMIPETATRLSEHVALNGLENVTIHRLALSDVPGEQAEASLRLGHPGQASIVRPPRPGARTFAVETTTLDAALTAAGPVRLLKLDLEGGELRALAGGRQLLGRVDCVIYERRPEEVEGDPVGALLREAGFRIRPLDAANLLAERGVADG